MRRITIFIAACFWVTISINVYAQLNCNPENSNLKKNSDLEILTDSSIKYGFGYYCGKSGMPPLGRQVINRLIKLKDFESIKTVLNGQNNVGKIYAIEALLSASQKQYVLTEDDKQKIKEIINQDYLIDRCQGCYVSSIKTIKLFNEKKFMKLLMKHKIKIKNRNNA
jgi:hypothetical protein